ncbi:MAG: hypothetical protein K2G55_07985 [Lachnospiraceae bacterium]|nr:hypothetical protein [Lachnospiraceae bacterium]MDE7203336.1 hypothetical protein [Lachnospiraceae bacterium]
MLEEQIKNAINKLSESGDADLCEELIRTQGVQSPAFAQAAFGSGVFYPAILYQDASPEIRDKLIDLLENEKADQLKLADSPYYSQLSADDIIRRKVDHCLDALAMIGDDTVVEYFQKWETTPKAWRKLLNIGPLEYAADVGGWCIEDGKRKSLFFEECYALEKSENAAPEDNVYGKTASEKCPSCGSSYVNMLVLDGRDERLSFLGINGKIKIKYCESCLPWTESVFCRYTEDGESTIIQQEGGSNRFFEDKELNNRAPFVLSKKMVPKSYCNSNESYDCAVGGRPDFIYGAGYVTCPECGKRMMHLAQLGMEFIGYGTHYIQICRDCKIVTATYQQT